ncbi:MAG: LysE family translocator [Rhodoferax sp.]|uniref:LysE family translocator n=1 Tax=Rhodoferax sp. TaxID=50421 RepID=UPI00261FBDD9|nr:LysE family translocator [Rhodoferax sp.]MDD2880925.1 LysE family translocator [Rhodoferax sp.]
MSTAELTALLLLCTAVSFTPGPNTTLSTALAANFGLKHALRFVVAVPVGWGLLLSLCASGVGALVVSLPPLRMAVTASGVAYLLWLAYKLWHAHQLTQARNSQLNVTFWQGVMLQFLNIKAWMLALTVVAGWLAGRSDIWQRFAVVLPLLLAFALASNLSYALMGTLMRQWLADPQHGGRRLRWFNRSMAAVLVATAAWMATI